MEQISEKPEFNELKKQNFLLSVDSIEFDGDTEPDYESLFEIAPELKRLLDLFQNHPAHPYNVLEHSVRAAQIAESDIAKIALVFHDFGKSLPECQQWVENYNGGDPVMKTPGHELVGLAVIEEIIRQNKIITDEQELELILNLVRYHDSWGRTFDRDFDEIVETFDSKTIEYLFDVQQADLGTHSIKYSDKYTGYLRANQKIIREAIIKKEQATAD